MTNSPEAQTPDSTPVTTDEPGGAEARAVPEAAISRAGSDPVAGDAAVIGDGRLDAGTFDRLVEPRSENRLELSPGEWHQVSRKYVWVQLISAGIVLVLSIAVVLVLTLVLHQAWAWIPGGVWIVIMLWTIAIIPRQARAIGYLLRDDDLVFRRGILWQRMVAVPYGRMQLVDITHGPLDRGFGIAQLKFVTAAASSGVVIPGLPQQTAESLRDHLVAVAESRRTGL